jgi:hypothetical protein
MFYLEDLDGRSRACRFLGDAVAGDMAASFVHLMSGVSKAKDLNALDAADQA